MIGAVIWEKRKRRRWTAAYLAVQLGVHENTILGWESEKRLPNAKAVANLTVLFKCPVSDLLEAELKEARKIFGK
jgi:transcriptional regulator with XRE-family HTH domain